MKKFIYIPSHKFKEVHTKGDEVTKPNDYLLFKRLSDKDYSSYLKDMIEWAEANVWESPICLLDTLIEASIRLEESKDTLPEKPSIRTPCSKCFYGCKNRCKEPCPNYIYSPILDTFSNKKGE